KLSEPTIVEVTVFAQGENVAPVALGDHYTVLQDTQLSVAAPGILQNDVDADGDRLKPLLVSFPQGGELVLNEDGSFIYTPRLGFIGKDRFVYQAEDEKTLFSLEATVTIEVVPAAGNTAPTAAPNSYTASQDKALTVAAPGVLDNDTDAENNPLTAVLETSPSNGTLTLNGNGSFTYVGDTGFVGEDTFTYRASDGPHSSEPVTVTIAVVAAGTNARPSAVGDSFSITQDMTLSQAAPGVLDNDSDGDGDALTAVLESSPSNGTLILNANGSFTYQPNAGFNGRDSFTYRATDGQDSSEPAAVTIVVLADGLPTLTDHQIYLPLITQ
ncbi:MAG: tandem-95 repeat protein, partial [Anaerolineales bacterium]|nr:tandem-95 repeat protein [Anaerolineales bacterium]